MDLGRSRWGSGVRGGASLAEDGLHPVLGNELQLLQLADPPVVVGGQEPSAVQLVELAVISLVVFSKFAEFLVSRCEPLDQGLRVGHQDLLAENETGGDITRR